MLGIKKYGGIVSESPKLENNERNQRLTVVEERLRMWEDSGTF